MFFHIARCLFDTEHMENFDISVYIQKPCHWVYGLSQYKSYKITIYLNFMKARTEKII